MQHVFAIQFHLKNFGFLFSQLSLWKICCCKVWLQCDSGGSGVWWIVFRFGSAKDMLLVEMYFLCTTLKKYHKIALRTTPKEFLVKTNVSFYMTIFVSFFSSILKDHSLDFNLIHFSSVPTFSFGSFKTNFRFFHYFIYLILFNCLYCSSNNRYIIRYF